jgi:hypothetical protein
VTPGMGLCFSSGSSETIRWVPCASVISRTWCLVLMFQQQERFTNEHCCHSKAKQPEPYEHSSEWEHHQRPDSAAHQRPYV